MKLKTTIIFILVLGLVGFFVWKKSQDKKERRAERLQFAPAERGSIEETVDATGEISPLNRVEIKPPIQGRIEKLLVDEGDTVKAGQVLAWMSSSDRAAILDAALAQGKAEVKYWQDAYKPTPILAPLSGAIILKGVVVGQTVDASTILFAMSDKLIVLAQVDEADIGRVQNGMAARITLDAYPDQKIEGHVFQILHEGTNVSNVITYGVKVEPKSVPSFFRSQMTANVSFLVRQKDNVILIPSSAVQQGKGGTKRVMVKGSEEKPEARDIETGLDNGQNVEVISGINEGEMVASTAGRYVPQKAGQNSPLAIGGNRGPSQRSGSSGRSRQ